MLLKAPSVATLGLQTTSLRTELLPTADVIFVTKALMCVDPDTQVHYSAPKSAHVSPLKPQQFYSKRPDATDASVPRKTMILCVSALWPFLCVCARLSGQQRCSCNLSF